MKYGKLNTNPLTRPQDPLLTHAPIMFGEKQIIDTRNGLTKREYFALLAMQGILSNPNDNSLSQEAISIYAVEMADKLIDSLNKSR